MSDSSSLTVSVLHGVLEVRGRILRNRRDLRTHLDRSGSHNTTPARPPVVNLDRLRNARVPESRLATVGDGERLLKPVTKQFLRTKAAARAAGIDLYVNDRYRQWLVKHADDYGFVNDVPSERWHWTYKPRG